MRSDVGANIEESINHSGEQFHRSSPPSSIDRVRACTPSSCPPRQPEHAKANPSVSKVCDFVVYLSLGPEPNMFQTRWNADRGGFPCIEAPESAKNQQLFEIEGNVLGLGMGLIKPIMASIDGLLIPPPPETNLVQLRVGLDLIALPRPN